MGDISPAAAVLPLVAAFSRHDEALAWAKEQTAAAWGAVVLESPVFEFTETDYYEPTMGPGLKKVLWAYEPLVDPAQLVRMKRQTNDWEAEYAAAAGHDDSRPLNLDAGYVTPAKLVLASTKDHAHRMYLANGIYAEVTLSYRDRAWRKFEWTFPDYQRADYHEFLDRCRDLLRQRSREDSTA